MFKKKMFLFLMLFACFFVLISSASAADYYVNNGTADKDINTWMKSKSTVKGNNLVFNVTKYELKDTLVINKAINVKSDQKTKIVFSKKNKDMFNASTSGISFTGINIDFNSQGTKKYKPTAIAIVGSTKTVNMKDVNVNVNNKYAGAVGGDSWKGHITNCNFNVLKANSVGISISSWSGNLLNSKIITKAESSNGIIANKWLGDMVDSTVSSYKKNSIAVYAYTWRGNIKNSKITNSGSTKYDPGFVAVKSKGTIVNSTIKSSKSYAAMVSDSVKITKTSLTSGSKFAKVYRYRPELVFDNRISVSGSTYRFNVTNDGYYASKACHLGVKLSNGKVLKIVKVKAIGAGKSIFVKVKIPSKYANTKYTKYAKIDYYNKVKEFFEKNNVIKFKF